MQCDWAKNVPVLMDILLPQNTFVCFSFLMKLEHFQHHPLAQLKYVSTAAFSFIRLLHSSQNWDNEWLYNKGFITTEDWTPKSVMLQLCINIYISSKTMQFHTYTQQCKQWHYQKVKLCSSVKTASEIGSKIP